MKNGVIEKENFDLFKERESFISYLDVCDGTVQTYKESLKAFFEYLIANNIKYPTRNDLKAFREELKGKLSIYTINSYLTAIRRFFKYLELNGVYEDITKDIKSLKTSKVPVKQTLSQEQCKKIYKSLTDKREKCLWALALSTGLRANELALSKIENIKEYNNEMVLFVKCKKRDDESEYVKLSSQVLNDIKDYIGQRTDGYIFISTSNNNNGGGVTNTTIRRDIKKILKRFGIEDDRFSCHSLRKTFATVAYLTGENIYDIQQVLHHHSISTTSRYISAITRDKNKAEINVSNILLGE